MEEKAVIKTYAGNPYSSPFNYSFISMCLLHAEISMEMTEWEIKFFCGREDHKRKSEWRMWTVKQGEKVFLFANFGWKYVCILFTSPHKNIWGIEKIEKSSSSSFHFSDAEKVVGKTAQEWLNTLDEKNKIIAKDFFSYDNEEDIFRFYPVGGGQYHKD